MDRMELEAKARELGADVFGVADVARFDELPADKHPRAIFPETQSVIVLGRRIPRGALRGIEEGTNFVNYSVFGVHALDNHFTSLTTFRLCEYLEDNGWEASPLPNLPPEIPPMGVRVRPEAPPPSVMLDLDDAAVRAGVGEIGYSGVLLTPRFGPRQRLQVILTDAPLEPTPLLQEDVCPREGCAAVCPLHALAGEKIVEICGKRMTVAEVDYAMCGRCKNGAMANPWHASGKPDRIGAVCIRTCVDCLEQSGRVSNTFDKPLRIREAWTVTPDVDLFAR